MEHLNNKFPLSRFRPETFSRGLAVEGRFKEHFNSKFSFCKFRLEAFSSELVCEVERFMKHSNSTFPLSRSALKYLPLGWDEGWRGGGGQV